MCAVAWLWLSSINFGYCIHCKPIPVMKTGFSLCSISHREKPVFINWEPCNENRFFLCMEILHRENPVLALYWPCKGLQCRCCQLILNQFLPTKTTDSKFSAIFYLLQRQDGRCRGILNQFSATKTTDSKFSAIFHLGSSMWHPNCCIWKYMRFTFEPVHSKLKVYLPNFVDQNLKLHNPYCHRLPRNARC